MLGAIGCESRYEQEEIGEGEREGMIEGEGIGEEAENEED